MGKTQNAIQKKQKKKKNKLTIKLKKNKKINKKMFAYDGFAQSIVEDGFKRGFDKELLAIHIQCYFTYLMPLMHAESKEKQQQIKDRYEELAQTYDKNNPNFGSIAYGMPWVDSHKEMIDQFGRFPHRNEILGRKSTDEEIKYMKEHDSMSLITGKKNDNDKK